MSKPVEPTRVSRKIGAIAESATLAVDAKAKALQAAGERVIGFGAGEPDFPTPQHIVDAAVAAAVDPKNHRYSPTSGLPELREAIAAKTARDSGVRRGGRAGARDQRRQARRLQHVPGAARPRRRSARAGAVLDHVPGGDRARRRQDRRAAHHRGHRLPGHGRRARAGAHEEDEGVAVRVAEQPHRRGVPARGGRGDRPVGGRARGLGDHRRDLRAPHVRRPHVLVDAGARARGRRHLRRAQRRGEDVRDDRLARGLDDRAARRDQRGHEPAVALDVEREQRRAARRRSPRSPATSKPSREMREAFAAPRQDDARDARRASPESPAWSRRARSTASRTSRACSAARSAARRWTTRSTLCEVLLEQAKVAIVPGEAFGAPGYARLSFALGDDDLGEGVERIATLLDG